MTWKYLFGTICASKAAAPICQYRLVNSPAATAVTHLVFDRTNKKDIATTLFHVAPKLPNLSTISIESLQGFTTGSTSTSALRVFNDDQERMNLFQLIEVAKSVTSWNLEDLSMYEALKPVLEANLSNIKSISLVIPSEVSPDPTPPDALSTLSLISSLTSLHATSFADRLTSLSIMIGQKETLGGSIKDSFLEFASLFPSLVRLQLGANDTSFSSAETPSDPTLSVPHRLPALKHLILHLPTPTTMLETLEHLELPALEHLQIFTPLKSDRYSATSSLDKDKVPELARRIHSMEDSLRSVELFSQGRQGSERLDYLVHCLFSDIRRNLAFELNACVQPFIIKHHHDKLRKEEYSEAPALPKPTTDTAPRTEKEEKAAQRQVRLRESWVVGKFEAVQSLAEWLESRLVDLIEEDNVGEILRVWKSLADLHEYRKWLEE
ncbi:uncharacterized protein JCM6883_006604 [Sporobolomyces salmoneus]|uniref:uncharacterized protein n=1 Tax=Sporobolomyces salmoneus TaxID=183962 RepID=UPI00316D5515